MTSVRELVMPPCAVCGKPCLALVTVTMSGRALCIVCRHNDAEYKRENRLRFGDCRMDVHHEHAHYVTEPMPPYLD